MRGEAPAAAEGDFETAFVSFLQQPGALMRWLLLKDLTILRRSPLQAALLVAYPILIALLIGFAISREPGKPRVAFLNQIPPGARVAGGERQAARGRGRPSGSAARSSASTSAAAAKPRRRSAKATCSPR